MTVHNRSHPKKYLPVIEIHVLAVDQAIVLQTERVLQILEMLEQFRSAHSARFVVRTSATDVIGVVIRWSVGHFYGSVKQPRRVRYFTVGVHEHGQHTDYGY